MQDLIFIPIRVHCPKCSKFADVSIESLDDNEEVICSGCQHVFTPDMDIKKFLNLVKVAEEVGFKS